MKQPEQNLVQLRQEAESQLDQKPLLFIQPQPGESLLHELIHELQVHQIELEMQNETLRQSQIALEASRDRYVDFYDLAPVGYITLNHKALIEEINLTGALMFGITRKELIHRPFAAYIAPSDSDSWYLNFIAVLKSEQKRCCQIAILKSDQTLSKAMMICQRITKSDGEIWVRILLADLSEFIPAEIS